jgi:DNA-binding transcriptional regulator YiaG
MTNMIEAGEAEILKTDKLRRVKTPAARRESLLDEFERSGLSGQEFATLAGIKYQTFATWVQKRRCQKTGAGRVKPGDPVRWLETVVEAAQNSGGNIKGSDLTIDTKQ